MKTKVLMNDFAETRNGIWLGLKWEGENFVDPATGKGLLSRVIIGKVPFAVPNKVREAEQFAVRNAIEDGIRLFRQGMGRGIRNASDVVELWIADPRFPKPLGCGWQRFPSEYNNHYFMANAGAIIPQRFTTGRDAAAHHLITYSGDEIGLGGITQKRSFADFDLAEMA